ncbi:DUF998 domain-containing protein [Streptomyces sp. NBC_01104]|uniref:DUF998 domain-containing protein n=1 Tax=Streptomyces sp. NBC_01104 TaxID=2903750 RepID=UPI003865A8DB|nr:DUF998 domain-containing protein [Streptomyces sp. NBC_01104]
MTGTKTGTKAGSKTSAETRTDAGARTGTLLAGGIVAGPLFLVASLIQGLTREGFDFTRNAFSQLSLGGLGWIQVIVFLLTGLLVIAGAIGMRRVLRGAPGGVWAPRLVGVFGASFVLAGVFTADPGDGFPAGTPKGSSGSVSAHGAVHLGGATVGFLALCAAFLVLATYFADRGRRGWALASRLVPVGVLAGSSASSVSVLAFTAGAALGLLWLSAVTVRLRATTPPTQHTPQR